MKRISSKQIVHRTLAAGGAALLATSAFALNSRGGSETQLKQPSPKLKVDEAPLNRSQDLKNSYAPIVEKVTPSVVKVFVSSSIPKSTLLSGQDRDFFRHFFGNAPGSADPELEHGLGLGRKRPETEGVSRSIGSAYQTAPAKLQHFPQGGLFVGSPGLDCYLNFWLS